jgi:hypothetical protein
LPRGWSQHAIGNVFGVRNGSFTIHGELRGLQDSVGSIAIAHRTTGQATSEKSDTSSRAVFSRRHASASMPRLRPGVDQKDHLQHD